jgi:hypothetical protein
MATATAGHSARADKQKLTLTGWSVFAGVTLLVIGGFNVINGFTALQHGSYYTTHHIVYSNLTFWGWAFLIWGILQIVAGGLTIAGNVSGNVLGVVLAGTSAILWFFMIFAAPWGALLGVTVSMMVVYGLTAGSNPDEY